MEPYVIKWKMEYVLIIKKKILEGIQTYKSILLVKCESGAYTREEFKDIVTNSLDIALSY